MHLELVSKILIHTFIKSRKHFIPHALYAVLTDRVNLTTNVKIKFHILTLKHTSLDICLAQK